MAGAVGAASLRTVAAEGADANLTFRSNSYLYQGQSRLDS
jgi:hypothetical protein